MPLQERRQNKRWPTIQANPRHFVKGPSRDLLAGIHAQVAFPILAVAPSRRHAGIVCLDGRLRAIVARTRRLRDHGAEETVVATLVAEFVYELNARAPGTVVVERDFEQRHAPLTDLLAERLVEHARESGFRVVTLSLNEACERISSDGSARTAAQLLLGRYEALAKRLAPCGIPLLRHERWREAKPLVTAFALAHAVGLDVLTSAAHPPGLGPPPKSL